MFHRGEPCVLVVGADSATYELLSEWLADIGCRPCHADAPGEAPPPAMLVVDVPFPRESLGLLRMLTARYPGVPVLALSATFLPSVEERGEASRALGVEGVMPKPLRREALVGAVRRLLTSGDGVGEM